MNSLKTVSMVVLIVSILFSINSAQASSIAFDKEKFAAIKKQNTGKQWLMLMWSVDCPPCFKELAILQKLKSRNADLAVVIINTDANDEVADERIEIIEKFELGSFNNFHFTEGKGDQSRFLIDSNWYGELPRSYFVQSDGKFHGKSGLVKESTLTQWLVR